MLLEIRRYTIAPGRRDEFVEFFDTEVLPAMEAVGMNVVGQFTSSEDDETFWYLRSFTDEAERESLSVAFYESSVWLEHLRDRALSLETGYDVDVVQPTPGSRPDQTTRVTQSASPR